MPCIGGVCWRGNAPTQNRPSRPAAKQQRSGTNKFGARSYKLGRGTVAQVPVYQPWQQQFQQAILPLVQSKVESLLGQSPTEGFAPIAEEARSQFQRRVLPSISERFASMPGNEVPSQDYLGIQAQKELEQNLAAQQSQYGLQKEGLQTSALAPLMQGGLSPQYATQFMLPPPPPQYNPAPPQPGFGHAFLGNLGPILGGLGSLFGPFGGAAGGAVGAGMSNVMR